MISSTRPLSSKQMQDRSKSGAESPWLLPQLSQAEITGCSFEMGNFASTFSCASSHTSSVSRLVADWATFLRLRCRFIAAVCSIISSLMSRCADRSASSFAMAANSCQRGARTGRQLHLIRRAQCLEHTRLGSSPSASARAEGPACSRTSAGAGRATRRSPEASSGFSRARSSLLFLPGPLYSFPSWSPADSSPPANRVRSGRWKGACYCYQQRDGAEARSRLARSDSIVADNRSRRTSPRKLRPLSLNVPEGIG
eukprot:754619-Hanusia_phi.AAC.3